MREVLLAFGRGLVKVLASLFVGAGVGLLTFGYFTRGKEDVWAARHLPGELFLAIGAALLTSGAMLLLLFGAAWLKGAHRLPQYPDDWPSSHVRPGAPPEK